MPEIPRLPRAESGGRTWRISLNPRRRSAPTPSEATGAAARNRAPTSTAASRTPTLRPRSPPSLPSPLNLPRLAFRIRLRMQPPETRLATAARADDALAALELRATLRARARLRRPNIPPPRRGLREHRSRGSPGSTLAPARARPRDSPHTGAGHASGSGISVSRTSSTPAANARAGKNTPRSNAPPSIRREWRRNRQRPPHPGGSLHRGGKEDCGGHEGAVAQKRPSRRGPFFACFACFAIRYLGDEPFATGETTHDPGFPFGVCFGDDLPRVTPGRAFACLSCVSN